MLKHYEYYYGHLNINSFIPVLPQSMSHFLEAQYHLYLVLHRSFHDKVFLQNDVVSCDLDNHFITVSNIMDKTTTN